MKSFSWDLLPLCGAEFPTLLTLILLEVQHHHRPAARLPLARLNENTHRHLLQGRKTHSPLCMSQRWSLIGTILWVHVVPGKVVLMLMATWLWTGPLTSHLAPLREHCAAPEGVLLPFFQDRHSELVASCKMIQCCEQPTHRHTLPQKLLSRMLLPTVFQRKHKEIKTNYSRISLGLQDPAFKYNVRLSLTWDLICFLTFN